MGLEGGAVCHISSPLLTSLWRQMSWATSSYESSPPGWRVTECRSTDGIVCLPPPPPLGEQGRDCHYWQGDSLLLAGHYCCKCASLLPIFKALAITPWKWKNGYFRFIAFSEYSWTKPDVVVLYSLAGSQYFLETFFLYSVLIFCKVNWT